jgi:hypothetical protein
MGTGMIAERLTEMSGRGGIFQGSEGRGRGLNRQDAKVAKVAQRKIGE